VSAADASLRDVCIKAWDLGGLIASDGRPVAELPRRIRAPTLQRTALDRAGVLIARRDVRDARAQTHDRGGCRALEHRRAIAELTPIV
jgi:hypothetical protein